MAHGENRRRDSSDRVIICMVFVFTNMIFGLYFLWTFVWNFNNYDTSKNYTLLHLLPSMEDPNIVLMRWIACGEAVIGHSLMLILFGFRNRLKLRFLILDAWTFTRFLFLVVWVALSCNRCDWPISRIFYPGILILISVLVLEIGTALLCNELSTDDETVKTTEGHVENIELESIQIMAANVNVTEPRNDPMKANSNDLSKPMNIIIHNEVPFARNV